LEKDLAILVLSCDKYESLWSSFFKYFEKYWPNCKFPIFLLTNKKRFKKSNVKNINIYPDLDWSKNLIISLKELRKLKFKNVLLIMEDCFLEEKVNQTKFRNLYKTFCDSEMDYLNLKANPRSNLTYHNNEYSLIPKGAIYRTAIVPNLWKISTLEELLVVGENAWEFETQGSRRSDKFKNFYTLKYPILKVLHIMIKGKIDRRVVSKLSTFDLKEIKIPIMNHKEMIYLYFRSFISLVFKIFIPFQYRRYLRESCKKYLKI